MSKFIKCQMCNGRGSIGWSPCHQCSGRGKFYSPQCMCPLCGSMVFIYGGGWRCAALHCWHNETNPIPNMGPEPDWWGDGTRVFKDGNAWCATHADFENIQESPAGFGKSPAEAVAALNASPKEPPHAP